MDQNEAQTKTDENQPESTTDRLAAILKLLTSDQIRFVIARQEFSKDKEAALECELSPNTVKDWKYKGAPIDDAVKLMATDGLIAALELRRRNLAKAMAVKVKGLDEKDSRLRQSVSTEIIEWEMGKATQKQEITGKDGEAIPLQITEIVVKVPREPVDD